MTKIRKLPSHIISQIAAGEVIERPAYAVKELIDNAIDAKATSIRVSIEDSGLKNITVSDNGVGMKKDDLLESFKHHTTSKLYKEEDLHTISSLGFRGEALSSLASVADLTIQSRYKTDVTGYSADVVKGVLKNITAIGKPKGTLVSISNIFAHVPARKKFLKSEKTEFRHIIDIVSHFALSYPEIEFSLTHNGREYFKFTKHHTLERRIQELLGDSLFTNLIPISFEESYVKIEGFVARPQYSIKGTSKVFVFVNKRRVYDTLITSAIKDAYKNLLEYGAYPIAILFLTIPYEMVDVNIHPRKEQVHFIDQVAMQSTIQKAVSETLTRQNLTFLNVSWKDGGTKTHLGKTLKYQLMEEIGKIEKSADSIQIHNLYLITQTKNGIMLIDQHAAHEAILFRKLKNLYKKQESKRIQLELSPAQILDISLSDKEIMRENLTFFEKIGFEIEEFGTELRVNSIPEIFKDRNIQDLILEFLEDMRSGKEHKEIDTRTYRMLSYLACRTAIKGGETLSKKDRMDLITKLQRNDMDYTCPHGRPVKIELSMNYLNTLFKRN
jgi:DNA mismatch repair protein MutL